MLRFLLILALAVVLGGVGLMYVWGTLNAAARGAASPEQIAAAVLAALAVAAIVAAVFRYLDRLAPGSTDHRREV